MNTIVKRILIITIGIAVLVFTAFTAINMLTFSNVFKKSIDEKVFNETEKFSNQISMTFENAEGSIDTLASGVGQSFSMEGLELDVNYIDRYMKQFSPVMKNALTNIEDAQGLYLTFNPEITDKKKAYEIWYSYDENGEIIYTDASSDGIFQDAFNDENRLNMNYYFNALEAKGEGVWTEPYVDPDINEEVITYSIAVYSGESLVGVIGTDISTEHTTKLINDLGVENNGMVLLLDTNNLMISRSASNGSSFDNSDLIELISDDLDGSTEGIFSEAWKDDTLRISFSELSNGWKLAIINYESELYKPYYQSLILILTFAVISIMVLLSLMFLAGRRVTSPIDKAVSMLRLMDLDHQVEEKDKKKVKDDDDILLLVDKAVKRQRTSDMMMSNQAKLATVGEMMANVTHQWKQPLNNINIIMGNLKDDVLTGSLENEQVLHAVERVEKLTTGMSETLKDFSEYLKPDKELVAFDVRKITYAALELLKDKIKEKNIRVIIGQMESVYAYGYKNSFYHVMLNVINNAIDAIVDSNICVGEIKIDIYTCDNKINIEVFDNGVQMSETTKMNLFKPYYTTKPDGTGLGLAIAKQFIEESMNGKIALSNYSNGVKCTIIIDEKE